MKTVILCGGYGTRIRDVADNIPKPMIPVGRYPILWHIMKYYASFGHKEFVLCLGYKGQVIKDFFLDYEAHTKDFTLTLGRRETLEFHTEHDESDWTVTLADTGLDTMTGARITRIRDYVGDDEFMLTYGDGLGDVDLDQVLAFHRSHGKALTVTGVRPPGRFGELVAASGRVGEGYLDEFSVSGENTVAQLRGGVVTEFTLTPEAVGLSRHPAEALVGGTPAENAVITRALLQGRGTSAQRDIVAFNAGAALYLAGRADDVTGGVRLAQDILAAGAAWALLERYAAYTRG